MDFQIDLCIAYLSLVNRNGQLLSPWSDVKIATPALLIVGESDYVNKFPGVSHDVEELRKDAPGLERVERVPGGHFFQEESHEQANPVFVAFLQELERNT